jgi:hypothetical protein
MLYFSFLLLLFGFLSLHCFLLSFHNFHLNIYHSDRLFLFPFRHGMSVPFCQQQYHQRRYHGQQPCHGRKGIDHKHPHANQQGNFGHPFKRHVRRQGKDSGQPQIVVVARSMMMYSRHGNDNNNDNDDDGGNDDDDEYSSLKRQEQHYDRLRDQNLNLVSRGIPR